MLLEYVFTNVAEKQISFTQFEGYILIFLHNVTTGILYQVGAVLTVRGTIYFMRLKKKKNFQDKPCTRSKFKVENEDYHHSTPDMSKDALLCCNSRSVRRVIVISHLLVNTNAVQQENGIRPRARAFLPQPEADLHIVGT